MIISELITLLKDAQKLRGDARLYNAESSKEFNGELIMNYFNGKLEILDKNYRMD
jgi:hypothetical protein